MDKQWYVVNTYSGHENKVKEKIEMRSEAMGMDEIIFRVVVPEQIEIEMKDGERVEKVKKMFPGYILIEMIMTDDAWYVVRNTPGVTGFIGSSGKGAKPFPLEPHEVDKILGNMGLSRLEIGTELIEGDRVNIIDGAFSGMTGAIKTINLENSTLELIVDLFGQETKVEVDFGQIQKV